MKTGKMTLLIILSAVLVLPAILAYFMNSRAESTGILHIEPEIGNYLYIERYDLENSGIDRDGVTWFFLPSYAELSSIDLVNSPEKLFLEDGSLLSEPEFGKIQNITVGIHPDETLPWQICFMKSSGLHTLFIDLEDTNLSDVEKGVFSRASVRSYSESGTLDFLEKDCLIKGRGNATWDLGGHSPSKKPYEIRFSEAHGLGEFSPKKKWVLLANAYEGTGILNKMVFDTARNMDMNFVTESDWADVYADGRYLGNYLICSEVQGSASSLLDTGGCIIEKNDVYFDEKPAGFKTSNDSFTIKAPKPIESEQLHDVTALARAVDKDLEQPIPDLTHIDPASFVKWYLLEEVFYNEDALITSCFFYTDHKSETLFAGPPWDFDGTCGEAGWKYMDPTGSILKEEKDRQPLKWYALLCNSSPEFNTETRKYFNMYMNIYKDLILSGIDAYYDRIHASMAMDRALYGRTGYGPEYTIPGYYDSVYNNIRFTKYFLYNRILYLAQLWDTDPGFTCEDLNDGTFHTLTLIYPDGSVSTQKTADGTILQPSSLPEFDPDEYDGWYYEANDLPVSIFLPVFEDTTQYLHPLEVSSS